MHLASCEHPITVFNHVLKKRVSVPCGHCNTCNLNRSSSWINRLEMERIGSKYCVFFTLTYSDEFLPRLVEGWSESAFQTDILVHKKRNYDNIPSFNVVNKEIVHFKKKKFISDETNNFELPLFSTIMSEQATQNIMRLNNETIPYLSVYDLQTFLKRFRAHSYRSAFGTDKGLAENQKIRYFVCGEYGPTTLRPHYHGLFFFDSDEIANVLFHSLSQSWLLGNIEYEFVKTSASSYVAKYINSYGRLPRIYRSKSLRPFSLSSRRLPIGLRSVEDSTVKEIFYSSSPLMSVSNPSTGEISIVPLWRSLEDRLFPKLPYYSSLSSISRLSILRELAYEFEGIVFLTENQRKIDGYLSCSRLGSFDEFCTYLSHRISLILEYGLSNDLYVYLCTLVPFLNSVVFSDSALIYRYLYDSNSVKRLFYVIRRISILLHKYSISLEDYLLKHENYWFNKDIYMLQTQYLFEEEFVQNSSVHFLLNIDTVKYDYFRKQTYSSLSSTDLLILYGFGFTFSQIKEIYKDENSRKSFFRNFHVSRCMDYLDMSSSNKKIYLDSCKTRRKNEYLNKHPEFKNLYQYG